MGHRWTVTGGDFRTPASLVDFPFYNIFTPEIAARGVRIQATHQDTQYTIFAGEETLTAGPRVPFRILAPQTVIGASAVRKIGKHLAVGGRFLQLSSSAGDIAENPYLFPPGRELNLVRTFAAQSLYQPFKRLKLYAEASRSVAQGRRNLLSSLAGLVWDTEMLTLRANYSRQGALYLPLVGYFAGDRQGPFVEARFRPRKDLELYGSASQYRNNLEQDPQVTSIASASSAAGASVTLPGRFSLNGQLSTIQFSSRAFGEGAQTSHNRQVSATLARSIRRHSLHLTWRDMQLEQVAGPQRQRATEAEDMFQVRRMFLGGAVRWQQSSAGERRNSLYYRASAQGDAGRLRAFANIEIGNDLANRTIFATNTYSTTVVGVGLRLFRDWSLQTEVFRNRLNMDLNPESIFVLEGGGLPIGSNLAEFNQWSFFFRLTKQIRWGGGLPVEAADRIFARAAPLVGAVDAAPP